MSALDTLQTSFQDYVLGHPDGAAAIAGAINEQFGLPATERLAIYYNAYRIRLREALEEAYEQTWTLVGDAMFDDLAQTYLAAHPSAHYNLRWFGAHFAQHAAQAQPDYPVIGELAAFEWALGLAFDAPDAPSVRAQDLTELTPLDWADLSFALHPSVQLHDLDTNAVALWQALSAGEEPPDPAQAPQCWIIWRSEDQPHFRSLDAFEAQAVRGVARGEAFGAICAAACEAAAMCATRGADHAADDADITRRMAGCLQNWLAQGLLTRASVPPSVA
ncbi:MAG: DNA-binding domain-containing protein [Pseudomonadota bacterium]